MVRSAPYRGRPRVYARALHAREPVTPTTINHGPPTHIRNVSAETPRSPAISLNSLPARQCSSRQPHAGTPADTFGATVTNGITGMYVLTGSVNVAAATTSGDKNGGGRRRAQGLARKLCPDFRTTVFFVTKWGCPVRPRRREGVRDGAAGGARCAVEPLAAGPPRRICAGFARPASGW